MFLMITNYVDSEEFVIDCTLTYSRPRSKGIKWIIVEAAPPLFIRLASCIQGKLAWMMVNI